jgi:hypothetical protein
METIARGNTCPIATSSRNGQGHARRANLAHVDISCRHFGPSKKETGSAPSSPKSPRASSSDRGRSPTPKKTVARLRPGVDNVQHTPLHEAHGDDAKGALAVAARQVFFHEEALAHIREYDPSDHCTYKSMQSRPHRPRQYARVAPQSEVEKLHNLAVSWQKSNIAWQRVK